jgi:hypothetical protein
MGNFVQSGVVKTAVRELAAPIADVAAFAEVVDDVVANNPFGCTAYQVGTESHAAVEKSRERATRGGSPTRTPRPRPSARSRSAARPSRPIPRTSRP